MLNERYILVSHPSCPNIANRRPDVLFKPFPRFFKVLPRAEDPAALHMAIPRSTQESCCNGGSRQKNATRLLPALGKDQSTAHLSHAAVSRWAGAGLQLG